MMDEEECSIAERMHEEEAIMKNEEECLVEHSTKERYFEKEDPMTIEEAREDIRLSAELDERVKPLLIEFAQLTMKSQLKKGITNPRYQFSMELTDYRPIFINRPSARPNQRKQLKEILDDYVEHGVLTKIIGSQWGHPITCVEKKCGKLRICADLRELNAKIVDKPTSKL